MGYSDVALGPDGDWQLYPKIITGAELIAQRARIRYRMYAGEYSLNPAIGVPYIPWAQASRPNAEAWGAFLRDLGASIPGVSHVRTWTASWTASTRTFAFSAVFVDEAGNTINVSTVSPPRLTGGLTWGWLVVAG